MVEEIIELLEPGNPNLKDPKQCAYREGREYRKFNLKPMQVLDVISNSAKSSNRELSRPAIRSFERLHYFTLGINGEVCNVLSRKSKDFCKEECNVSNCEYKGHNIQTS